jgi:hypothetical protein
VTRTYKGRRLPHEFEYDVCLSFAREDRTYVRQVAKILRERGVRVFFDEYLKAELWGKDLYTHLDDVYQNAALYCVLFISRHYARRVWTNHERASAQARALTEHAEYILPARFDSTRVAGLRPTVGYVDLSNTSCEELADLISKKLGENPRENFFPPVPDKLFQRLGARSGKARRQAEGRARGFFGTLTRMSSDEREVIFHAFVEGCPTELPDNVHIALDLLRRTSGFTPSKILRLLGGLSSLGYNVDVREESEHEGVGDPGKVVVIEWHGMTADEDLGGNATLEASEMILGGSAGYCEKHALEKLRRLDFSQLASPTSSADIHEIGGSGQRRVEPSLKSRTRQRGKVRPRRVGAPLQSERADPGRTRRSRSKKVEKPPTAR